MKHIQPKTMTVVSAVLHSVVFSQRGLWRVIKDFGKGRKISLGQVNKVVMDLERMGYVSRSPGKEMGDIIKRRGSPLLVDAGRENYYLVDPLGLLRYISLFRRMEDMLAFRLNVEAGREEVIRELSARGAAFCLGTAQEDYSAYFRPGGVDLYHDKREGLLEFLNTAKRGITIISVYKPDVPLEHGFITTEMENHRMTTKVQTVIDMFCDNKAVYTKPLLKELWGVEI